MPFTTDQVLSFSPDLASTKAGQQLANSSKWVTMASTTDAIWGECQGSGKTPYRTMIDLKSVAFKCSCPSRKFPCKHSLGLFLLYVSQPAIFQQKTELPDDIASWLDKRHPKDDPKTEKFLAEVKEMDEEARQKRIAAREKKIKAGIEELRSWLGDIVRGGIMHIPKDLYNFDKNITARMVDAQAAGLAAQLRRIHTIDFYKKGWQSKLLKRLSKIYLLTEAYLNKDLLAENLQSEVNSLIGWAIPKADLTQKKGIRDAWSVLAIEQTEEDKLRVESIWLYGMNTHKYALLLNFYGGNQIPEHNLTQGLLLDAELIYYPAATAIRATTKEIYTTDMLPLNIQGNIYSSKQIYEQIANELTQNPFMERLPFMIGNILLSINDNQWWAVDGTGYGLPLANSEEQCWNLLAYSKGQPIAGFCIYQDQAFYLKAIWLDETSPIKAQLQTGSKDQLPVPAYQQIHTADIYYIK